MSTRYQMTIGIECHVQLKTKTKLFAAVDNDARTAAPNTTVSALCFGLPGVLPVLNQHAVELAMRAGVALNARIAEFSKFDRKHYFYPDSPLGYQITQFDQPILGEGYVDVPINDSVSRIRVERAHLEADAGKLTHPTGADYSLVDLNRVGTPLLEIVSMPDIHSAAEAKAYARELYLLMKYADVSDVDLYYGHMRFDVNISIAPVNASMLGTRAEIKNLNSFRSVEKAAEYEYKRQAALLDKGEPVVQETRGWNEDTQQTFSQRSKEDAHDYRYFPDPDLPPIVLSNDQIDAVKKTMGTEWSPQFWRAFLARSGVEPKSIEAILENGRQADRDYFGTILTAETLTCEADFITFIANWIVNHDIKSQKDGLDARLPNLDELRQIFDLKKSGAVNSNGVSSLFHLVGASPAEALVDVENLAKEHNLVQMTDSSAIEAIVADVLAAHVQAAQDVQSGEMKAIGFLVGQVMKQSKGQANPQRAQELIKKQLGV